MPIAPVCCRTTATHRGLVILLALVLTSCAERVEITPTPSPTATTSPRVFAQAAVARGDQARASGDLAQALAEYTRAIELDADLGAAYLGRAQANQQTRNLNQALLDYDAALARDPNLARAWLGRGEIQSAQLAADAALADFTRAIELDPRLADAYIGRGALLANRDQFIQAIADYTTALELDAKSVGVYVQRAAAYGALGMRESQIADLSQVIELTPQDAGAYVKRAVAFTAQQKLDRAIDDYTRAIRLEPKSLTHYANRARAFQDAGKPNDAIADYSKMIELDAKNAETFYQRGHVYARQGERAKALSDFASAIRLNPNFIAQPLIDPVNVQFNFGDDVPDYYRLTIQNSVLLAQNYLNSQFDAQVNAYTTTAALLKSDAWLNPEQVIAMEQGNVIAMAGHQHIAVLISPRFRNYPLDARFRTLSHEYYHLWQDRQSHTTGVPSSKTVPRQGPLWLIEGCAEYVEEIILEFYGMKPSHVIPYVPLRASLMAMESKTGANETYPSGEYYLGYYACQSLEKKAGKDAILRTYWETLGKGGPWQESFKSTFGISPDAFYAEFEAVRQLTPTPTPPATRTPTRTATPTATPRP